MIQDKAKTSHLRYRGQLRPRHHPRDQDKFKVRQTAVGPYRFVKQTRDVLTGCRDYHRQLDKMLSVISQLHYGGPVTPTELVDMKRLIYFQRD